MVTRYSFWWILMLFNLFAEDPKGRENPVAYHVFQWDLYLIVICTVVAYVIDVLTMKHRSSAEKATRAVRLTLIPLAYLIMIIAMFTNGDRGLGESLWLPLLRALGVASAARQCARRRVANDRKGNSGRA